MQLLQILNSKFFDSNISRWKIFSAHKHAMAILFHDKESIEHQRKREVKEFRKLPSGIKRA